MPSKDQLTGNRKSLALVSNSAWYVYNLRLGVIRALQIEGCHITVIAPRDQFTDKLIDEGCDCIEIPLQSRSVNPLNDLRYLYSMHRIYQKTKFDFVYHYTIKPAIFGTIAASWNKIPCISVISGLGYTFLRTGILNRLVRTLYRIANARASEVWFVNEDDQIEFESSGLVENTPTRLLPGEGIDTEHFSRMTGYQSTLSPIHFLFSGRLIHTKGIGEFVLAAAQIKSEFPDVQFAVLGFTNVNNPDAVSADEIRQWESEGIIRFYDAVEDVRPFLEKTSCFVLPSYYGEGTPRSLLEASSMEIPIITTDHVGCRDVVRDKVTGLLCEPKHVQSLVQTMKRFIQMPDSQKEIMGQMGRQWVTQRFGEKAVLDFYVNQLQPAAHIPHDAFAEFEWAPVKSARL